MLTSSLRRLSLIIQRHQFPLPLHTKSASFYTLTISSNQRQQASSLICSIQQVPSTTAMHRRQQHNHHNNTNNKRRHQHKQQPPAQRQWETCANTDLDADDDSSAPSDTAATSAAAHLDLTIMSYNVLAQHLIGIHPELYARHRRDHLAWPHRLARILHTVREAQPTVLCLQEVQLDHAAEIAAGLARVAGLDAHRYQKRTAAANVDGCAIFWRSDRVRLRRSHSVEYAQPHVGLLDRPNVALLAHFEALGRPAVRLLVATTHLLYNPRREDVRVAQTQLLLAELDRCAWLGRCARTGAAVHAPVVLTGDLNAGPQSATLELLTRGVLRYAERVGTRLEQANGNAGGTGAFGRQLLPVQLGITDECQHVGVLAPDHAAGGGDRAAVHVADMSATWLHHSRANCLLDAPAADAIPTTAARLPFQTGCLRHNFGLRSVYDDSWMTAERRGDDRRSWPPRKATTFHDDWLTVDYILYSRPWCARWRRHAEGAALRLLARWRLPSVGECQMRMGCIPNAEHGSDHVAVAARFRLGASEWVGGDDNDRDDSGDIVGAGGEQPVKV